MKEKIATLSILANLFLAGSKIVVGYFFYSTAIIAEGLHSLTDVFSSFIGYFGIKASQKPVDQKHPYGHYKLEVLSGLIITLILLASGLGIIYGSYQGFLNPERLNVSYLAMLIMFISAIVNFATSKIKVFYGQKENSLTLISDGVHDRADVLTSLAVLAGLFLSRYWIYFDPFLAFLIGLYIIKESFSLGKEAIDSLLDVSAGEDIEEKIKSIVKDEKIELEALKTQKKGSALTANLEIVLPNSLNIKEATKISENLRSKLIKKIENLLYVAIQINSHELETDYYKPLFGKGFGWQRQGLNKKVETKTESSQGMGPGGLCICPKCGYNTEHKAGHPCAEQKCPKCNVNLERK